MIPVKLNPRNFMSYTNVHQPLLFDGIHLAVLSGDNGHGKSALLDAITWALWGKSRAVSQDDLVHTGATEMEVEYEFLLNEQHYRVIRKRQKRGKGGISDLQFFVLGENGFRSLSERSVAETEKVVQRTLRMSYNTFVNSSFILQGRADSFTTNPPGERKKILSEILQLDQYERLEQLAKAAYSERQSLLDDERRRLVEWDEQIKLKPSYEAQVETLRGELKELDSRLKDREAVCKQMSERVARLQAAKEQFERLQVRLEKLNAEYGRAQAELKDRERRLGEAQKVTARQAEIEKAFKELTDVRALLAEADRQQGLYLPLARERDDCLAEIKAQRTGLEASANQLRKQRDDDLRQAEKLQATEAEERASAAECEELGKLHALFEDLRRTASTQTEARTVRQTDMKHLKEKMQNLRERLDELVQMTTCPVCQRALDAAHKTRLRKQYEEEGQGLKAQFRTLEQECKDLDGVCTTSEKRLRELEPRLAQLVPVQRRLATAQEQVKRAREAQVTAAAKTAELQALEHRLQADVFAEDARKALARVQKALGRVTYDEKAHTQLRTRAGQLERADQEHRVLEKATQAVELLGGEIQGLKEQSRNRGEELKSEAENSKKLAAECDRYAPESDELRRLEAELTDLKGKRDTTRESCTRAEGLLDHCAFAEREREKSLLRQDELILEQSYFGQLTYAFSKKGIQALLIDLALPEIEEEANRLLGRMTSGRMNVKFESQRELRSGNVSETLDIKISDELGTRSYEMFSGGESFRVNFAIRVALSRLLCNRAGTRLQTLVIDEGFGTQDQDGRERIVEAIQAIGDEFEKVLVITHLEDIRDHFPVRIEVTKTPRGSVVNVR